MYLENAPFHKPLRSLQFSDLVNYGFRYKQIVLEKIPTSQQVTYLDEAELKTVLSGSSRKKNELCRNVFKKKQAICIEPDRIILPLNLSDRDDMATMLTGIDKVIIDRSSPEWLTETKFLIEQEFLKSKNQLVDQLTSLYNETAFNEFLSRLSPEGNCHILLAASLASARSAKQACLHVVQVGRLLEDFNRYSLPLFHLGNSIFAFVVFNRNREFLKSFCQGLTSFFRTNGQRRLHLGFSAISAKRHPVKSKVHTLQTVVDEAWTALQKATRRGPFSFCDFELFAEPDIFPVRQIGKSVRAKLAYRLKDAMAFSIALIRPDYQSNTEFRERLTRYLEKEDYVTDREIFIIVRKGKSAAVTGKWLKTLQRNISEGVDESFHFSAGISGYPFHDFGKGQIIDNCAKALLHASFYGPGNIVEFDSLSLNVSGDAYFSEGDLATAVREYQKGLDISADDVNLLNSLGVAYGLMNRTNDALRAFDRALEHDPDNFMALYNKGLGKLSQSDDAGAAECFTRARLLCDRTDPDEAAVLEELEFQLGVCLFRQRKYRQAIEILENWNRSVKQDRVRSRSCRYLGIGYYRIGDLKLSSTWLQRAVHADEADAEALSLLGEVYVKTGQGNEIGLKLCEKSIELEPGNIGFHLRYGRVLSLCGHYTRSTEVLNRCFRTPSIRAEAWLEAAANGYRKGDAKEGEKYAVKVIKAGNITAALKSRAKTMLNENRV